ncbi:E3 ubiquitin-protein ligase ptr1 [Bienertia sinuspersici]
MDPKLPKIFTCNDGYSTSKGALAYLDDKDYDIGHRYILGNCEFLKDFERLFEEHVIRTYGCINAEDVWTTYDNNFSSWFKGHVNEMAFQEEAIRNPPLLSEVRQDDGDDDLHWDPHDYTILDEEEEEVAVEEDELEEDEEEEEEEEGEGEDDEEEEDNNDDGGAADDLDGII